MSRRERTAGGDQPETSRWQRLTGAVGHFALKPTDGTGGAEGEDETAAQPPDDVAELEAAVKRADDKERLIGLMAAPVAAGIVFLVMSALVHNDPPAPSPHHVNPNVYTELGLVTLALALIMLVGAWFRKRLVVGAASALYGLSFFNLHYWGFGVPFILIGSWYLVRAYRLSQRLKLAKQDGGGASPGSRARPRPSKRYTPPSAGPGRAGKSKPAKGTEPG